MARALFAGIIATAIVSALVYVNVALGFVPQFDMLAEIRAFNRRVGLPVSAEAVWLTHAVIGIVVYGLAFAVLEPILPGRGATAGMAFGVIAWLAMMVTFMPLAGRALFAQDLGGVVIVASLALHLVYGAVLGVSYAALREAAER